MIFQRKQVIGDKDSYDEIELHDLESAQSHAINVFYSRGDSWSYEIKSFADNKNCCYTIRNKQNKILYQLKTS